MTSEDKRNLQDYILDSMTLIAKNQIADASYIKKEEGTIVEIVDEALGKYKVKYYDNIIPANSAYVNMTYTINEKVYLLSTNDDLEEAKLILGAVTPSASNFTGGASGSSYLEISDNLFNGMSEVIELSSYYYRMPGSASPHDEQKVDIIGSDFNTLLTEYINSYTVPDENGAIKPATFSFGANIKTVIPEDQFVSSGDYGICLELPTKITNQTSDEQIKNIHKYYLNTNTLTGNPYQYPEFTFKNIIVALDDYEVYDSSRYANIYAYVDNNFKQDETKKENYDIFIKDISLKCVEVYEVDTSTYNLSLVATDGPNFLRGSTQSEKTIKPVLRIGGKNTSIDPYNCYWFREDVSVKNSSNEFFNAIGGVGWKCLNTTTVAADGTKQLILTEKTLTILQSDVLSSCRYKCVLDCEGVAVSAIINIKNLDAKVSLEMVSSPEIVYPNSGIVNLICKVDYPELLSASKDKTLKFEWVRHDKNDNLIIDAEMSDISISTPAIEGKNFVCHYDLPVSYINYANTIYCSVYVLNSNNETTLLGTVNKTITVTDVSQTEFTLLLENADLVYKYDTDGNSPMLANYNGAIGSVPTSILPIDFKIFKKDGTEFTKDEYGVCNIEWTIPKNSLFSIVREESLVVNEDDNNYYVKNKILPYEILGRYDAHKAAAEITLKVDFQGTVLQNKPRIIFTKDGESGTNGSMYTALITHNGYAYNEYDPEHQIYRKLKFVWVCTTTEGNGQWYYHDQENKILVPLSEGHEYGLDVVVYKGTTLQEIEKKVTWSIFDKEVTNPCFNISDKGILSKRYDWETADSIFCTTVEAKVQVGNLGETDSEEYIYAYYPIEITRLSTNGSSIVKTDKDNIIPHIADGYSTVVYAEDGTNPTWNTQPFKCISPSIEDADLKGYYSYVWSSSNNLITENRTTQSCTFDPVTKFDSGISKNYVKVQINAIKALKQEDIDSYKENANKTISGYQKLLDDIDTIKNATINWLASSNTISINNTLTKAEEYLTARSLPISIINSMKIKVNEMKSIFNSKDDLTYFKKVGYFSQYEETYGTEFFQYIQQYISKLCTFNLSQNYDGEKVKTLKIEDLDISGLEPDEYFVDYLSDTGKTIFYNTINDLLNFTDNYNNAVDKFAKNNFETYVYENSYNYFMTYIEKLVEYKNNEDLIIIANFNFEDKENVSIMNILKQLLISYQNIVNLKSSYDEGDNCIIKDIYNTTNSIDYVYFKSKIDSLDAIFNTYGDYEATENSGKYNIKESLLAEFDKGSSQYVEEKEKVQNELDARDAIYSSGEASIIHIKPIVMTFNRYGNSYINGWDGNKLYIDEENGQYLFAPQVGAGYKEEGRFTGMLMGLRGSNGADATTDVGLFGYNKGEQSIFLDARKGSATFGISGEGQIILDPTIIDKKTGKRKASITSGNYKEPEYDEQGKKISEGSGMEIDLAIPAIKYGTGNFSVDEGGNMTAQTGWIGGWEIGVSDTGRFKDGTSVLHSPKTYSSEDFDNAEAVEVIYLDSNAIKDKTGKFIRATKNQNAAIYTGNHNLLEKTTAGFFIDSTGMSINSYFRIDKEGVKVGDLGNSGNNNYWIIKGKPTDGLDSASYSYIACGTEEFSGINAQYYNEDRGIYEDPSTSVYLGTNGICLGDRFWVNPEGYLYSEKGRIANWLILKNRLLGNKGRMDFNSDKGYLSYISSRTSNEYGSAETKEDIFNTSKGFILGTDGLYFGKWDTYMDADEGYMHSGYGDIGGFHFSGNEMETGYVPKTGYMNEYSATEYLSSKNILKKARGTGDFSESIDEDGNTIKEPSLIYNPYSDKEEFRNYMKLSAKKSALMFNTFDFTDLYDYFSDISKVPVDSDPESASFEKEEETTETGIDKNPGLNKGVYLGKKGITIGTNFSVSSSGNLYARKGLIGGWLIKERSLSSPIVTARDDGVEYNYKTVFKPEGTLQGGRLDKENINRWDKSKMWKLNKNGEAWFTNIKITGGKLNINNNFVVNEDGSFRAGKFRVDNKGVVYCTDAYIGGFHFGDGWTENTGNGGTFRVDETSTQLGGWLLTDTELKDKASDGGHTFFSAEGGFKLNGEAAVMSITNSATKVSISNSEINMSCNGAFLLESAYGGLSLTPGSYGSSGITLSAKNGGSFAAGENGASIQGEFIDFVGTVRIRGTKLDDYIKNIVRSMGVAQHNHSVVIDVNQDGTSETYYTNYVGS